MTTTTFEALKQKKPEDIQAVIGHVSSTENNFFDDAVRFGQHATADTATFWGTYFAVDTDIFQNRNTVKDSYYYIQYDNLPLLVRQQFPRWFQYKFDHFEIDYYPMSLQYTEGVAAITNAPGQPKNYNYDMNMLKTTAFGWGQHSSEIQYNSAVVGSIIKEFRLPITRSSAKRWYTVTGSAVSPYQRDPTCATELQYDNIMRQEQNMRSINIKVKPYAQTDVAGVGADGVTNEVAYSSDFHATATRDGTHDKRAWGACCIRNAFTTYNSFNPLHVNVEAKVRVKWQITFNKSKNATALPSDSYTEEDSTSLNKVERTWPGRTPPQQAYLQQIRGGAQASHSQELGNNRPAGQQEGLAADHEEILQGENRYGQVPAGRPQGALKRKRSPLSHHAAANQPKRQELSDEVHP